MKTIIKFSFWISFVNDPNILVIFQTRILFGRPGIVIWPGSALNMSIHLDKSTI